MANSAPPVNDDQRRPPGLKFMRALVVDDVDINREMFRMHLEFAAQHIDEAADGFAALDMFKRYRYDVVLLDIEMPGLDGYDTMAEMRKWEQQHQKPGTPILAVTSSDFPGDRQRILDAGASAYLAKPLKQKDLMNALQLLQFTEPAPHPLANLFPKVFDYADAMLGELEAFDEPEAISKKLHQLRGMMAVYGFESFAERVRLVQLAMQQEGMPKKTDFAQLRKELRDLKTAST
ncbi:MAG: response regulator [Gammaproteobacteria bacterium]|nr:response regulator [Gammaproteobacteria bacterium]MBU1731537.1 response regulator [Gammaproteobacteria bacterium]MBU1893041.1 response regulator [Gammaproteobacteria bacterium]